MTRLACIVLLSAAVATAVAAQEVEYELLDETTALRPGEGMDVAEANCGACHSYDYIETQPSAMGQKFWHHEVEKMIVNYGAMIEPADAATITAYLTAAY